MDKVVKGPGDAAGDILHQTIKDTNPNIRALLETASVERVYGVPVEVGATKIIPAAENLVVMGFGAASGSFSSEMTADEENQPEDDSSGEGLGGGAAGGGRTLSRPVAIVIASPDGVRVEPVADRTKVIMAAITAAGFVAGMFFRMSRGPK